MISLVDRLKASLHTPRYAGEVTAVRHLTATGYVRISYEVIAVPSGLSWRYAQSEQIVQRRASLGNDGSNSSQDKSKLQ